MSGGWAIVLSGDRRSSAVRLLARRDVRACEVDDANESDSQLWLHIAWEPNDEARRLLPGEPTFRVDESGTLFPVDGRVPCGQLPAGDWRPLREVIQLSLPEIVERRSDNGSQVAGPLQKGIELRLVRSEVILETSLMLLDWHLFREYVETAPQWRLERWAMVVRRDGRVAVRGTPLPALPGTPFVVREGVAVPSGWTWSPRFDASVVREAARGEPGDVLLLTPVATDDLRVDAGQEAAKLQSTTIPEAAWVQVTRGSVRATQETFDHGRNADS